MASAFKHIGFIGLGVMGEPICRNLLTRSNTRVTVLDANPEPVMRLVEQGAQRATSRRELLETADIVFLSLPSGEIVEQLARAEDGFLNVAKPAQTVVDLGTTSVETTRALAKQFSDAGKLLIDAPVARTRAAAEAGTLSVMVGAAPEDYERVLPLIETFASDITLCGPTGCGQVVKILNNMVLFEVVTAVCEARAIAQRAGVETKRLFDTLAKGSADSFGLRNHGIKAILPASFPERAFSVDYARKDLGYALQLARNTGVSAKGAHYVDELFALAIANGDGALYWPVIDRLFQSR
ncbi:NAD(P)-dependent oxidoreductase [Paraburkholderia caffeinilytica]|uniref:NAD(P)-dependent oxidoreductase n=1 Tax=Paraburkholderia caffeinilytica TaxID=1761016 RepID=UPI0038BB8982